jgi:hypothetical protein
VVLAARPQDLRLAAGKEIMMFRKKSVFERAHRRIKKRRFFDRRSTLRRMQDALNELARS